MLDVTGLVALSDAAFEHFEGIKERCMFGCSQASGAASRAFRSLTWGYAARPTLTDAAFVHLGGILELKMAGCSQATITDSSAFTHLVGIQKLSIRGRTQVTDSQLLRTCRAFRS
jgi:hypothetical protein